MNSCACTSRLRRSEVPPVMAVVVALIVLVAAAFPAYASGALSFAEAIRQARAHQPQRGDTAILARQGELARRTLTTHFFPQLTLGAQTTYQSDVVSLPGNLSPAIANLIQNPSKTQYRITAQVKQVIFDGLTTHRQRALERAGTAVSQAQSAVSLYGIRDRVTTVYFGVMLARAKKDYAHLLLADLDHKLHDLKAASRQGLILLTNVDRLRAERLYAVEVSEQASQDETAALQALSELIGRPVSTGVVLAAPDPMTQPITALPEHRPEWSLFATRLTQVRAGRALLQSTYLPKVAAFASGGYGQPGLNPLDPNPQWYYVVGVGLSWKPWDWGQAYRKREDLALSAQRVQAAKRAYAQGVRLRLIQLTATIKALSATVAQDDQLVFLRGKIRTVAAAQLAIGTLLASDYIRELNAEAQARLSCRVHQLQLALARQKYANIQGDALP